MKKNFYSEANNIATQSVNDNIVVNTDNERRKELSIETNRRRRDMALRVKMQIEREEERRREELKRRREYHQNLNSKMRSGRRQGRSSRIKSAQLFTITDVDRMLDLIRNTGDRNFKREQSSLTAWGDPQETCRSPMAKYGGVNGMQNKTNDFYLKTFETRLMEQEQLFKTNETTKMDEFSKLLEDSVSKEPQSNGNNFVNQPLDPPANRTDAFVHNLNSNHHSNNVKALIENIYDDDDGNDSIQDDSLDQSVDDVPQEKCISSPPEPLNSSQQSKFSTSNQIITHPTDIVTHSDSKLHQLEPLSFLTELNNLQPAHHHLNNLAGNNHIPIKSILKKNPGSRFGSNPDLSKLSVRDSVEVAKVRSSRMSRSSSYSQGINDADEDSSRKIVRFADDQSSSRIVSKDSLVLNSPKVLNQKPTDQIKVVGGSSKSTIIPSVPSSTSLKPPLHPRTAQEGSYLQATFKRPTFHPPPKPRKISAEVLEQELGHIIVPKKTPDVVPKTMECETDSTRMDQQNFMIAVDKTPTEKEIDMLWEEVRECLSKSRKTTHEGSIATAGPCSVRTIDSGSESSVRSAPAWQKVLPRPPPFHVKHHNNGKPTIYPGQELPIRDTVTLHPPVIEEITQQQLTILGKQDHRFQEVSESLEEFLAVENACNTSKPRITSAVPIIGPPPLKPDLSNPNVFLTTRPSSHTRPIIIRPTMKTNQIQIPNNTPISANMTNQQQPATTQLSMDEEKIKMSLDRLNERLKNVMKMA